ncbi:bifunctional YncE family protein/alkaline phosphatase family protein [Mucilaginibacter sabulilitoris]|uniref:Bifunctional YncE family protein/alkaline phosphatase family protein n=1 Tax=Mucilaginibacter sabulilitoris TaxID=1173583 RepID=A0ABZ0TGT8_9SPHI|nr:bifunctional YncE family protein/alkaline phosphatase family protein [Mucilaginibacter sabulilitoris]WPU91418.1 bifunctional YncE family protein/alkaline phosphatase family protein [Mucilaginibacter sabulilitoris]
MRKQYLIIGGFIVMMLFSLTACHTVNSKKQLTANEQVNMHSAYDDSTLNRNILPVLMPYNRVIDPAGKVISFGDPGDENHSMDVRLIPGSKIIAVEDRFGITLIDTTQSKVISRWTYKQDARYRGLTSTYSGLKVLKTNAQTQIFWSAAAGKGKDSKSYVFQAIWDGEKISIQNTFTFKAEGESPLALPNDLAINNENGTNFLYVVLNGNNQLVKINLSTNKTVWTQPTGVAPYGIVIAKGKVFVTNWAGPNAVDTVNRETAGVPYGKTYIDPKTGATAQGTVMVMNLENGGIIKEIEVGLHPNAIISSIDEDFVYVANGNSDMVSVISANSLKNVDAINVKLNPGKKSYIGDTPNALAIDSNGTTLYVANGLDNAVAVVKLGSKAANKGKGNNVVKGFIPTEAYPGGLAVDERTLFVTNLEGEGSRIGSKEIGKAGLDAEAKGGVNAYNSHHQKATVSIISLPDDELLKQYTKKVLDLNLSFRQQIAQLLPRKNIPARPIPERIGEPSVFNHVLYIIKENRTYDQVLGDMPEGDGAKLLCIYGDSVTPNQHSLARNFLLLDNYYVSGKCSAEGHQWTDAAMVTDYVEKSVRSWFRSYPHVQEDALVYDGNGFIWNNAADHGKTVRIYGEACAVHFDNKLSWSDIYNNYKAGKPFVFNNTSTISRVRPMLSQNYPGSDEHKINEQLRASAFIKELNEYEKMPGDQLPQLMVMALSADHTVGTRPGYPTPEAMVADNDLALGRMVEALSKSRFWKNTVIFVTEDDSQAGWDHVSAYRTTGFVISPYSRLQGKVSKNYNQTCIVRSIEQILGLPPMNIIDATALPMFDCFTSKPSNYTYKCVNNRIPLNRVSPPLSSLKGSALHFAQLSSKPEYDHIDDGNDDVMNRILWFAAKGKKPYPAKLAGKDDDD